MRRLAQSNLDTFLTFLCAFSQRQPDVLGFKASLEDRVCPGNCGEVGLKPDLLIYLHLFSICLALADKEQLGKKSHCNHLYNVWKQKHTNSPSTFLIARLSEMWNSGCMIKGHLHPKCEAFLQSNDSDEKCVPVCSLAEPRTASASRHCSPSKCCGHVLHVRQSRSPVEPLLHDELWQ